MPIIYYWLHWRARRLIGNYIHEAHLLHSASTIPGLVKAYRTTFDRYNQTMSIEMEAGDFSFHQFVNNNHGRMHPYYYFTAVESMMVAAVNCLFNLHSNNYFHGDFKPENVICVPNPNASNPSNAYTFKVIDLGSAARMGPDAPPTNLFCTYMYASPESLRLPHRKPVQMTYEMGAKLDAYSLGVSLYYAIFKRCPIYATNRYEAIDAHDHHGFIIPPLSAIPSGCPIPLYTIMMCLLNPDPDLRMSMETLYFGIQSFPHYTVEQGFEPGEIHIIKSPSSPPSMTTATSTTSTTSMETTSTTPASMSLSPDHVENLKGVIAETVASSLRDKALDVAASILDKYMAAMAAKGMPILNPIDKYEYEAIIVLAMCLVAPSAFSVANPRVSYALWDILVTFSLVGLTLR